MSEPIISNEESDSEDDRYCGFKLRRVTKTSNLALKRFEYVLNAKMKLVLGNLKRLNLLMLEMKLLGKQKTLGKIIRILEEIKETRMVKPVWNNSKRVNHQNFGRFSHPNPKSNIVPQALLTKSGLVSLNTAKSVRTAQPRTRMNDVMQKPYSIYKAYSSVKRSFNKKTVNNNRYFNKRVNTLKGTRVNTVRTNAEVNTVKASASWVWKPKHEDIDHVSKSNSASKTLTRYDYVDALGRFKSVLAWDFKRH
ncbi:hypothetical protein Tco_1319382 [Tanacetum coccineum]